MFLASRLASCQGICDARVERPKLTPSSGEKVKLTTGAEVSNASVGLSNSHGCRGSAEDIIDHDSACINIVVGSGWAMDDHRSANTITVLTVHVGVVPASTILVGLEGVCTGLARSHSTFRDTWNTVLVVGTLLEDTMPMNGGCVIRHLVGNSDLDSITPVAFEKRTWHLAVDGKSKTIDTIIVEGGVCDDPGGGADLAGLWAFIIVVGVDTVLSTPLASVRSRVAASLSKRLERLGHIGCIGASSRASSVDAATSAIGAAASVPVTPARVGGCSGGGRLRVGVTSPGEDLIVGADHGCVGDTRLEGARDLWVTTPATGCGCASWRDHGSGLSSGGTGIWRGARPPTTCSG